MRTLLTAVLIALPCALPCAALAQAQTVWRCGADGRTFSDTPCAQGQATNYAVARPVAEVDAAQSRAQRERQLADKLTSERLQSEAASRGNGLAGMQPLQTAVKPKARLAARHKPKRQQQPARLTEDAGTWPSAAPASRRTRG
jgi:hypothetical protein